MMNSRTSAATTFVASLVLLVVALGTWVTTREGGVGTVLQQVTSPVALDGALPGGPGPGEGVPMDSGASDPSRTADVPGDRRGGRPAVAVPSVPRADATRIEAPREVAPPRRLAISSVGISMPIEATGVRDDGQMELPDDPDMAGWYRFGALPGDDRGSAVLGGHVDSVRYGVGPLARLAGVEVGARIVVTGADGERVRYRVTAVERIRKTALPTDRLFDPDVDHRLVVVTCGGRYLPEAGGYEDNIVVVATPIR